MPWARLMCKDLSQEIITSRFSSILSRAKEGSVLQCIYWILCWRLFLTGLFKFSCGENHLFIITLMISDKNAMLRNKTRSFDCLILAWLQVFLFIYQLIFKGKLKQIFVWPTSSSGCQNKPEELAGVFGEGIFSRVSLWQLKVIQNKDKFWVFLKVRVRAESYFPLAFADPCQGLARYRLCLFLVAGVSSECKIHYLLVIFVSCSITSEKGEPSRICATSEVYCKAQRLCSHAFAVIFS